MKKIVVLLTACLLIAGASLSIAAQVVNPTAVVEYDDLDFRLNPNKTASAQMGDVLDSLEGVSVSDAEKAYIRYDYDGQRVLYFTKPALVDKQYEYDGEHQQLTITLSSDQYMPQKHDAVVTWIPHSAKVGDTTAYFEPASDLGEGNYRVVLTDVAWSANVVAQIEYRAQFEISAQALNQYLNAAYDKALELHGEQLALDEELAAYREALQAYEQNRVHWAEYEKQLEQYEVHQALVAKYRDYLAYKAYLEVYAQYEVEHNAYLENKSEWDSYYADCDKYTQYLNYKDTTYPGLLQSYHAELSRAQSHLDMLALLQVRDPNTGVSFMEMVLSDSITPVIEQRREEMALLVGSGTVNDIISSTQGIQKFCRSYQVLTTDQEKYAFYIREHAAFAKNLRLLYTNLKKLYETNAVYTKLQKEYPSDIATLVRMLGLLYVQRCVFDDTVKLNLNEIVDTRGNQSAGALVHESLRPTNDANKATPLAAWPQEPAHPDTFEVTSKPTEPATRLEDAVAPEKPVFTAVEHEQELDEYMEDPGEMAPPALPDVEEIPHPGPEPTTGWSEREQTLYKAYLAGEVAQRPLYEQGQSVTAYTKVNCPVQLGNEDRRLHIYFYNTDDQGTYLGHSLGVEHGQPAYVPEDLPTPQKPPELEVSYVFAGWVDQNGNVLDTSCMTDDVNAYASYTTVPRKYQVTWNVGDAPVVQEYEYGQLPVYSGTFGKSPDAQYVYLEFLGWDKTIVPVNGDVVYTAQYKTELNKHKVTFLKEDGTITHEGEYAFGRELTDVAAALPKPYRAPDAQYTYTFLYWKDDNGNTYADAASFPTVSGPVTFTPEFSRTVNSYTVTWMVEGETFSSTYLYGETPVFGETPTKPSTERVVYDFDGWDKEIAPVSGDVTYIAQFISRTRFYYIEFVVDGESFAVEAEYEQLPLFGSEPRKDSDVQYDYLFVGWDREPVPAREDAIYIAEFKQIVRKYPVKFIVGSTEVISEFEYGKKPKYPNGTPAVPDDGEYCYAFTGWDKSLAEVDGTAQVYTACFDAVPLIPGADGEIGKLTVGKDGVYTVKLNGSQADLSRLFEKAGREQAALLEVYLGQTVLVFSKAQIDAFYLMGEGIGSASLRVSEHRGYAAYSLELLDQSGAAIPYLVTELTLKLPYQGKYSADVYWLRADGTETMMEAVHQGEYLVFDTMELSTFFLVDKFLIETLPAENGKTEAVGNAYAGQQVTLTPDPDEGYHVDKIIVEYDGNKIEVEPTDGKYSFAMPNSNVKITTEFKVVEGGTVAEVVVGIVTALLIVAIGFVIVIVLRKRRSAVV